MTFTRFGSKALFVSPVVVVGFVYGDRMRVILNSDIIFQDQLVRDLPRRIRLLIERIRDHGHEVVLPRTTILEFDRKQLEAVDVARRELRAAFSRLDGFGIQHDTPDLESVVQPPDLVGLVRATGVSVTVEEPTNEDLAEAHRRACLHEPPHPPESKSDEMRDLVIWMTALRLAADGNGALLVSRDAVHSGHLGDEEADAAALARVRSVEEALEYFEVVTPSGEVIRAVLGPVWRSLVLAGLPASEPMVLLNISRVKLRQGPRGLAAAECLVKARAPENRVVNASIQLGVEDGIVKRVTASGVSLDGELSPDLDVDVNARIELPTQDFGEDIAALQAIIEGEGP